MPLVVFDLDGTLIDSSRDLADSANELLEHYGARPLATDAIGAMVGDGARQLVTRALGAAGVRPDLRVALRTFLEIYDRHLLVHTRPYDGIADVLRRTTSSGARLAMLTNKPEAHTRRLLEAFGWSETFRWVIGGDGTFARKPDPAALRALVAWAETTPEATLMVGDSMIDVETGRRAGTRVCAVLYGLGTLRGPLTLAPGELAARTPADLADRVATFLADAASPSGRHAGDTPRV